MDREQAEELRKQALEEIRQAEEELSDLDENPEIKPSEHRERTESGKPWRKARGAKPGPRDWEKSPNVHRRCKAHKKDGEQCKNAARYGMAVCDFHGGKAPQVKAKAKQRLDYAADAMAQELLKMATSQKSSDATKLAAIRDALDRAGLNSRQAVDVNHQLTPFEQTLYDGLAGMTREESRAARGLEDDLALSIEDFKGTLNSASSSGSADTASDEPAPALVDDDTGSSRPQGYGAYAPAAYTEPPASYLRPDDTGTELEPIDAEIVCPDNDLTGDEAMAVAATFVRSQRVIAGPRQQRALPIGRST